MAMMTKRALVAFLLLFGGIVSLAHARQSPPPPGLCDVARSILREARGDVRLAEMIARKRGVSDFHIALAKRFCSKG
jgi:hypothetical protein